jgi:hypothetical protein
MNFAHEKLVLSRSDADGLIGGAAEFHQSYYAQIFMPFLRVSSMSLSTRNLILTIVFAYLPLAVSTPVIGQSAERPKFETTAKTDEEFLAEIQKLRDFVSESLIKLEKSYVFQYNAVMQQQELEVQDAIQAAGVRRHPLMFEIASDESYQKVIRLLALERIQRLARAHASKMRWRKSYDYLNDKEKYPEIESYLSVYNFLQPDKRISFTSTHNILGRYTLQVNGQEKVDVKCTLFGEIDNADRTDLDLSPNQLPESISRWFGRRSYMDQGYRYYAAITNNDTIDERFTRVSMRDQFGSVTGLIRSKEATSKSEEVLMEMGLAFSRQFFAVVVARPGGTDKWYFLFANVLRELLLRDEFVKVDLEFGKQASFSIETHAAFEARLEDLEKKELARLEEMESLKPGKLICEFEEQAAPVRSICVAGKDGSVLASCAGKKIILTDLKTRQILCVNDEHLTDVIALHYLESENVILSLSRNGELRHHECDSLKVRKTEPYFIKVSQFAICPDSQKLAVATEDEKLWIFDTQSLEQLGSTEKIENCGSVAAIDFDVSGSKIVIGGKTTSFRDTGFIHLFDAENGKQLATKETGIVRDIRFSRAEPQIIAKYDDGFAAYDFKLNRLDDKKYRYIPFATSSDAELVIVFSEPIGPTVAGMTSSVRILDLSSATSESLTLEELSDASEPISAAFAPDKSQVFIGYENGLMAAFRVKSSDSK